MKTQKFPIALHSCLVLLMALTFAIFSQKADKTVIAALNTADMDIKSASVEYFEDLDLLVFKIKVRGEAGQTAPKMRGEMNGAPVLGYVFPTSLRSDDVGFDAVDGVVALAVTAHPDFDDTPLWDENNDRNYENDGVIYHTHWVVLNPDTRVAGGLAVRQFDREKDKSVILPPTNPGMPMYMDSPGYSVVLKDDMLRVLVPAQRIHHKTDFTFDAVAAYMEVSTEENRPLLGVYRVFKVLSGDLSLPFKVKK